MNVFNKYEAVGILVSIGIMAVALGVTRFNSSVFTSNALDSENQIAGVVVAKDNSDAEIKNALLEASTDKGKLMDLVIDDVKVGTGEAVKSGDTVTVNYEGTTQSKEKFDSSYERGEPFIFTVGEGKVIQGWEKGLIGMKIGGQRILVIPSELAYGNRQVGPIAPNSTLVFSIELLDIK